MTVSSEDLIKLITLGCTYTANEGGVLLNLGERKVLFESASGGFGSAGGAGMSPPLATYLADEGRLSVGVPTRHSMLLTSELALAIFDGGARKGGALFLMLRSVRYFRLALPSVAALLSASSLHVQSRLQYA
eukprot:CAMPEP_0115877500 /NCGR_PEP_ID=MMETSP0287-20121206/26257_1 /TAXON_ID=412157 /ORGANISM="Chrysochromulina rotalis, Strain UIO044" /LENGTH=131 /DNA_ID=CAMNT_0003333021 /DNA_START=214 /DNA_END=609 /DNA_ORIENTATION=-